MVCDKSIPFLISINMGISTLSSYIENSWSAFWIWRWITQTRSWLSLNFVVPYFYKEIGHEIAPVHWVNWVLLSYPYVLVLIWHVGLDHCIWAMFHPKEIQISGLKLAAPPPRERALATTRCLRCEWHRLIKERRLTRHWFGQRIPPTL